MNDTGASKQHDKKPGFWRSTGAWFKDPDNFFRICLTIILTGGATFLVSYLTLHEPPDFSLSTEPVSGVTMQGETLTSRMEIEGLRGYDKDISLSTINAPEGISVNFTNDGGTGPSFTSSICIHTGEDVPNGQYHIRFLGAGGDGKEHICTYVLNVNGPEEPRIDIVSPTVGENIQTTQTVIGSVKNMPEHCKVRVFTILHQKEGDRYYPQFDDVLIDENGVWSATARVGENTPDGEHFQIAACISNTDSEAEFLDYREDCIETGNWPGLERLPESIITMALVEVTYGSADAEALPVEACISSPEEDSRVAMTANMSGKVKIVPGTPVLWLIVHSPTNDLYYPHENPLVLDENGNWDCTTCVGLENEAGQQFEVLLVSVDDKARQIIISSIEEGLSTLPEGVTELDRITVTRDDDRAISAAAQTGTTTPMSMSMSMSMSIQAQPTAAPSPAAANITRPVDGDISGLHTMMQGTSTGVTAEYPLWVFVYVPGIKLYYPNSTPADIGTSGNWTSLTYVGSENDGGTAFQLVVTSVDKDAREKIEQYIDSTANASVGMPELPEGAEELDRITITRSSSRFTYPENEAGIGMNETIAGIADNLTAGSTLWVAVYVPEIGKYYPQQSPVTVEPDGTWTYDIIIGEETNTGAPFELILLLTNEKSRKPIDEYLKKVEEGQVSPGMPDLPEGAMQLDWIMVMRR